MDPARYLAIINYLDTRSYPIGCTTRKERRKVAAWARKLMIYEGRLFRRSPDGQPTQEVLHAGNAAAIIQNVHQEGHFGLVNTWRRLRLYYDGYQLYDLTKAVVKSCQICQVRARRRFVRQEPARPIMTPQHPFYLVGLDAVGPIVKSKKGNSYLLVAVDHLTRWPVVAAVPNINEITTAEFLMTCVVQDFGVPRYLLTDRGSNFKSCYVEHLLSRLGCRHLTTTAFRPQSNGLVERANQTLVNALAKMVQTRGAQLDWDCCLPEVLLAMRTMTNSATGYSPAMLLYGYNLRSPAVWAPPRQDYVEGDLQGQVNERIQQVVGTLEELRQEARAKSDAHKVKAKTRYDATAHPQKQFVVGSLVLMLERYHEKHDKFHRRWVGPFVVHKVYPNGTYKLVGKDGRRTEGPVNGDALKQYYDHRRMIPQITTAGERVERYLEQRRREDASDFLPLLQ